MMASPPSALRTTLRASFLLAFATLVAPVWAGSLPNANTNEVVALRNAIKDLTATFGGRYPSGSSFLARLDQMEQRAPLPREDFENLRRQALIANPLVSGQPLLYVVRSQYRPDHHNTETMFQTGECNTGSYQPGGPLKTIDFGRNLGAPLTPEKICRDGTVSQS